MDKWNYVRLNVLEGQNGPELWCYHLEDMRINMGGQLFVGKQWRRNHQIKQGIEADEMDLIITREQVS